jgi:hypothetical protein
MQSLFDPVMNDIIRLVSEEVKLAEELSGRKLDVSMPCHSSLQFQDRVQRTNVVSG